MLREYNESIKRHKLLRLEKVQVENSLRKSQSETGSTSLPPAKALEQEIEKKQAYRKGVENMLRVTDNEQSKKSLQDELRAVSDSLDVLERNLSVVNANANDVRFNSPDLLDIKSPPNLDISPPRFVQMLEQKFIRKVELHEPTTFFMALDESDKDRWVAAFATALKHK